MDLTEQEREAVLRYLQHLQVTGPTFSREPEHTVEIAVIGDRIVGKMELISKSPLGPDSYDPHQPETIDFFYKFEGHRKIVQFWNPDLMPEDEWQAPDLPAIRQALRSEATFFVYLPTRGKTLESLKMAWQAWNRLLDGEMSEQWQAWNKMLGREMSMSELRERSRTLFVVAHEIEEENAEFPDLLKQGQAFSQQLGASFMRMKMDDFEQGKVDLHAILSRILYQRAVDHGFTQIQTESCQEEEKQQTRAQNLRSRLRRFFRKRSQSHDNTS